jgi:hypothetical protein
MKAGALVKVEILTPGLSVYSYGILVDDEARDLYDGREKYKKIWVFKYPESYGKMEPKNMLIQEERITHIKTFEDW